MRIEIAAPSRRLGLAMTPMLRDWLGFVLFPHHRVLRPATLRRMRYRVRTRVFAHLDDGLPRERLHATFASYDGLLRHVFHGQECERLRLLDRCL